MTATARQVIADEVTRWIEAKDYAELGQTQRLEEHCDIWRYAKWCRKGGLHRLGIRGQIDYRASRSEPTAWDALSDLSDDEAMTIHAATVGLTAPAVRALKLFYEDWQTAEEAAKAMRIRKEDFLLLKRDALETMANRL
jgi:hypothetical protein